MTRFALRLTLALALAAATAGSHAAADDPAPATAASAPEAVPPEAYGDAALVAQVHATETAFAQSMADRDFAAFAGFIADDAIFVNGTRPRRGKTAILAAWEEYFSGPVPFSWKPETVVVLETGQLAQTKGPVFDPEGNLVAEFRSTWRRQADGEWKIVFDDGTCTCAARPKAE
jgi:ketosteroid isomerase-like protein